MTTLRSLEPKIESTPAILDGPPVRQASFPPRKTMGQAEREAVLRVMDSDQLSAFIGSSGPLFAGGKEVRAFEDAWAEKYGFKHAISVNSWTSGLMAAIGAVGVEPGDEVICSPYTMSASATCALFYGGIPVFADIDPVSFCLDPASIEACITERTKAIVVVHLLGHPADMDAILEITRPRGIRVIEDAAQAPGVYYRGRAVGAIGDVGGFSLNFHKHIHTGEGGMLVTNQDDVAHKCRLIRNHGENAADDLSADDLWNHVGGNFRLTELQAAIGREQLKRLPGYLATRTELADQLIARLSGVDGLTPATAMPDCTHGYYIFPIKFDARRIGISRHLFLCSVLAELPTAHDFEDTPLTEGYVRPLYLSRLFQQRIAIGTKGFPFNLNPGVTYNYHQGLCPVAERMYEQEMLLCPLVREPLTADDIDDVAAAILKVTKHADKIGRALADEEANDEVFTPVDAALNRDA